MEKFNFPGIVGCIDCTHIAIIAPPIDHPEYPGFAYLNRKEFHSINCQIICDSNLRILNCNARYPGSMLPYGICQVLTLTWKSLIITMNVGTGFWVIQVIRYSLGCYSNCYSVTPIEGAEEDTPESRYTSAHIHVRNSIESCNGVLKSRFRCLLKHHYTTPLLEQLK